MIINTKLVSILLGCFSLMCAAILGFNGSVYLTGLFIGMAIVLFLDAWLDIK